MLERRIAVAVEQEVLLEVEASSPDNPVLMIRGGEVPLPCEEFEVESHESSTNGTTSERGNIPVIYF